MSWSAIQGDCRDVLRSMADTCANQFHACVTDPPYHLTSTVKRFGKEDSAPAQYGTDDLYARQSRGFMRKLWDGGDVAFQPETWRLVYGVLRPGGHLLAFGGTRTYHRLVCAIEDAGFEIRDCVLWAYGCLDDQSEALTRRGWILGTELRADDDVMQWDHETGILSWVRPSELIRHHHNGPMVQLKNRNTDQMLTPNHRVFAKVRKHSRNDAPFGYEVYQAVELRRCWQIDLPLAGRLIEGTTVDPDYAYIAGWWLTDAWPHADGKACMFSQSKPATLSKLRAILRRFEPSEYTKAPKNDRHEVEHTFYVTGHIADQLRADFPDRKLPWGVISWSEESRRALFRGLMDGDGSQPTDQYAHAFWSQDAERRDVFSALCVSLGFRSYVDAENGCVNVNIERDTSQLQAKHRLPDGHYDGEVWCVRVPTGAFVARRNGRPFITGNSGFPKSHDVAKGIDKSLGAKGTFGDPKSAAHAGWIDQGRMRGEECEDGWQRPWMDDSEQVSNAARQYIPGSPEAEQWKGWGSALKPAVELVVMARKPLIGTIAQNVTAYGTGALNIDESRVEGSFVSGRSKSGSKASQNRAMSGDNYAREPTPDSSAGRWPANLIHDGSECVVDLFPKSSVTGARTARSKAAKVEGTNWLPDNHESTEYTDSGSASRFFKSCRDGEDSAERRYTDNGVTNFAATPGLRRPDEPDKAKLFYSAKASKTDRAGSMHPTVKPLALMRYLIKLVTVPGGYVLDPFAGSGTTLQAAVECGMNVLGIEAEAEYHADILRRMENLKPVAGAAD